MSLRVGLITSEFPPDHGGVETYAWQLAKELGQRPDLQITVYAPPRSAKITAPPGVTIKPILKSCMGLDWPRLKDEPIDVWHALSACHAWIVEKNRPTVVSIHGNDFLAPYPLTMRPALSLPGLRALRRFIWRRLRPISQRATHDMLARAMPRATAILSNSRYTAEVFLKRHPGCADKVHITGVGVEPGFFEISHAATNRVPQLLTVSRLSEPRKNIDLVLRALASLKDRFDFEYTVAGEGPLRPELEKLADSVGLGSRVRFVGRVSDADLRSLYASADLFILTASITADSHEGFGIVYLEAAACGVPSLAARLAGAAEAVDEGCSGFFVETPDVPFIHDALARYLGGEIRFDADTCRNFARGFSWTAIADVCEATYRQAAMREL